MIVNLHDFIIIVYLGTGLSYAKQGSERLVVFSLSTCSNLYYRIINFELSCERPETHDTPKTQWFLTGHLPRTQRFIHAMSCIRLVSWVVFFHNSMFHYTNN